MNRFIAGALGGLIATVPMTVVMTRLWQRLPRQHKYPLPPREITEITARCITKRAQLVSDERMAELSLLAHFTYGGATGALYPLICREPRHPFIAGTTYGVGVWAASYLGWVPATRILKPATRHPAPRNRMMIMAHLVWGGTTILIGEHLRSKPTPTAFRTTIKGEL